MIKNLTGRLTGSLWLYFVTCILVSMVLSFFLTPMVMFHLTDLLPDLIEPPHGRPSPFLSFLMTSLSVGTVVTVVAGWRILRPITRLSKAMESVAEGNFHVQMDPSHHVTEVRELALNFNKMVRELGSIETLRTDFVVNVSHEFKTPLAAIEGYATLLQDESLSSAERQEYTQIIIESARQLSTLTGNVLRLSKLENQEILTDQVPYRLDEQLRQAVILLEPQWEEKNLDVQVDLERTEYCGNAQVMLQVWLNLLGNAVKFTPPGGRIRIKLEREDGGLYVTIADSGVGMSPQVQEHIFDKFYQGDVARERSGNGLGLALVKRILDLSGGRVQVESRPGEGSTFTVFLKA